MKEPTAIVWFRQDLRLDDNPALLAAVESGKPIVPIFIFDPDSEGDWSPGSASRCWLHSALKRLDQSLRDRGSRLIIREGGSLETLLELVDSTSADGVFWNRRYEPAVIARDTKIKTELAQRGLRVESSNALLLFETLDREDQDIAPVQGLYAVLSRVSCAIRTRTSLEAARCDQSPGEMADVSEA